MSRQVPPCRGRRRGPGRASPTSLLAALLAVVACGCSDRAPAGAPVPPGASAAFTVSVDPVDDALLLTPATALAGASVYGVVATSRISDRAGRPLRAAPAFAADHPEAPVRGRRSDRAARPRPGGAGQSVPGGPPGARRRHHPRPRPLTCCAALPDVPAAATGASSCCARRPAICSRRCTASAPRRRCASRCPRRSIPATVDASDSLLFFERADGGPDLISPA